jgi:hypothetical protein
MSTSDDVREVRIAALEAASRIVAENLRFLTTVNSHANQSREAERNIYTVAGSTALLAQQFEAYLNQPQDARPA